MGSLAESPCRASSCSTQTKSSRTRSKISLTVRTEMASPVSAQSLLCVPGCPAEAKKPPEVGGGYGGYFFRRQVSHRSKGLCHLCDVGWLVSPAALPLRSQVGRVGLDQQRFERQLSGDVPQILGFRIRHVSRERGQETHVEAAPGLFERAAET